MKIRATLALASVAVLLGAPSTTSGPAPNGRTIRGQVLDSIDGEPLSGVWVMAWDRRQNPRFDQDGLGGALARNSFPRTHTWDEVFSDSTGFYEVQLGLGGGLLFWKGGYEPLVVDSDSLQVSLPPADCSGPADIQPTRLRRVPSPHPAPSDDEAGRK